MDRRTAAWLVASLADHPSLIREVAAMRHAEWGTEPGRSALDWWIEATTREAGNAGLPLTLVAIDDAQHVGGAVGLGDFDPPARRDRSPWVLGMIVTTARRGAGIGRLLLTAIEQVAADRKYEVVWVATGDSGRVFYERCGWRYVESIPPEDPGWPQTNILAKSL